MNKWIIHLMTLTILLLVNQVLQAQNSIEGTWLNAEKSGKIQIFKSKEGKYFGKIIWLSEAKDQNGKPKSDINNPNKELKNKPLMGLIILKNFSKTDDNKYEDGTIYDPKNGKTYSCIMTLKNAKNLDVRGYIGVSIIGRTTTFTKVD